MKQKAEELKIPLCFNLPYKPEFNGIEEVFSLVKRNYKREKLNTLVNKVNKETKTMIKEAFESVKHLHIQNCITHSQVMLNNKVKK